MAGTRLSSKRARDLRKLAELMNQQNPRYIPITSKLIECFDVAISPEENGFLLRMGTEPHTYDEIADMSGYPEETFRPFFENILKKGLMAPEDAHETTYALAPILVGWFEMFLSDGGEGPEKQEFARRLEELFQSFKKFNFFPLRNLQNFTFRRKSLPLQTIATIPQPDPAAGSTTIPVQRNVAVAAAQIHPARSVTELIEQYGEQNQIAVVHCFCRQWHKMIQEPCRFGFPAESCVAIGDFTRYVVKYGIGRYVAKGEAVDLIQELEEKGAIHQIFYEKEDLSRGEIAICNCCWDCCGMLGSYNRGVFPLHFQAFYVAEKAIGDGCTGCGICSEYCPVNAVRVADGTSAIDPRKCIGCGKCALKCPEDAISLRYQEREVFLPIPKKSEARIV